MKRRPPGETREKIYRYMRERLLAGDPPTVREVQWAAGLKAVESARVHLERLVDEGRLDKDPNIARGYRLPPGDEQFSPALLVPLLGRVQAGGLTAAIEEPDGHVAFARQPGDSGRPDALIALRVQGDSMTGIGILDGDVVLVRRNVRPRDGDVVVALVDGEATVKTLRLGPERKPRSTAAPKGRSKKPAARPKRRITLVPANRRFKPIVPDPDRLEILGRVIEVRRFLANQGPG